MTIQMIQAAKLSISALNVRKTNGVPLDSLKADIAARGVLQNLIAIPSKKKGQYEVTAGGRRLQAVQALIADGVVPKTFEVPVLVLDDTAFASESSLAENFQRAAMNPADECIAFRHFIESEGASIEDVARRFGVEVRFVLGRVRLANLAEPIFEALRNGDITLDVAKAYGSTTDQDRQIRVWESMRQAYNGRDPGYIRRELARTALSANSQTALFVGRDAYVDAGGRLETDLFGNDEDATWIDVELAERLAAEKLAAFAQAEGAKLGVAKSIMVENPYTFRHEEGLVPWDRKRSMTEEEAERQEALLARLEEIDESEDEEHREEAESIGQQLEALDETLAEPVPEELKEQAVAVVFVDREGVARTAGIYLPKAVPPGNGGDAQDQWRAAKAPKADVSEKLRLDLAADRTEILQLHLASDPTFTIDLAAYLLAEGVARNYGAYDAGSAGFTLKATREWMRGPQSPANEMVAKSLADLRAALECGWTELKGTARFDAFRTLEEAQRAAWLAFGVAQGIGRHAQGECKMHDHVGETLAIDSSRFWRPTAANYFNRVSKTTILRALNEVGGAELENRYAQAKKGDLAAAAERIFSGTAIVEPDVAARAASWVPAPMRFGASDQPDIGEVGVDEEDGDSEEFEDAEDIEDGEEYDSSLIDDEDEIEAGEGEEERFAA